MDGKEQIPGLDPQGREPSSGRLISTRARAYKVQAESQVDTEQAIEMEAAGLYLCVWRSRKFETWDFPGGPVVKNPPCRAGGTGSIPAWGTKIPHAAPTSHNESN